MNYQILKKSMCFYRIFKNTLLDFSKNYEFLLDFSKWYVFLPIYTWFSEKSDNVNFGSFFLSKWIIGFLKKTEFFMLYYRTFCLLYLAKFWQKYFYHYENIWGCDIKLGDGRKKHELMAWGNGLKSPRKHLGPKAPFWLINFKKIWI